MYAGARIIVPSSYRDGPAVLTLLNEGVPFEEVPVDEQFAYGNLLADLWESGETFVIVEHDIAPWPSATMHLALCENLWCVHRYHYNSEHISYAMGFAKFSGDLTAAYPKLPEEKNWRTHHWQTLDSQILTPLVYDYKVLPCVHVPPVAHVRRP